MWTLAIVSVLSAVLAIIFAVKTYKEVKSREKTQ